MSASEWFSCEFGCPKYTVEAIEAVECFGIKVLSAGTVWSSNSSCSSSPSNSSSSPADSYRTVLSLYWLSATLLSRSDAAWSFAGSSVCLV